MLARTAVASMKDYIQAHVQRSEFGYQAECFDLPILTHGESLDEAVENLHGAIHEFLHGKDLAQLGLAPQPKVMVSFHFGPYAFADM
jgi:predicted RNase H-like HicB family nuclease